MKNRYIKILILTLLCIAVVLTFAACGGKNGDAVKITSIKSDISESSYSVSAYLTGTDFSTVGQILSDKLAEDFATYDGMTQDEKLLSSRVWGVVYLDFDTPEECTDAIGLTVNNPLESLDMLKKETYGGGKRIRVTADASTSRQLHTISIDTDYLYDDIRLTLTQTQTCGGEYITGSAFAEFVSFNEKPAATDSGISVSIVTASGGYLTSYTGDDFNDINAYWTRDNIFYSLRIYDGLSDFESFDKAENLLSEILAKI